MPPQRVQSSSRTPDAIRHAVHSAQSVAPQLLQRHPATEAKCLLHL
jgi:hypothetical protein